MSNLLNIKNMKKVILFLLVVVGCYVAFKAITKNNGNSFMRNFGIETKNTINSVKNEAPKVLDSIKKGGNEFKDGFNSSTAN